MNTYIEFLDKIKSCSRCELHKLRSQVVHGDGSIQSKLLIIGECPGPDEEKQGKPFVGRAGKLLRHVMNSIGLEPDKTFITNIVKCYPHTSLNPSKTHVEKCSPYLVEEISFIRPSLIITLGRFSSEFILSRDISITKISGKLIDGDIPVLPIVHPSYVLRGNIKPADYGLHFLPALNFI